MPLRKRGKSANDGVTDAGTGDADESLTLAEAEAAAAEAEAKAARARAQAIRLKQQPDTASTVAAADTAVEDDETESPEIETFPEAGPDSAQPRPAASIWRPVRWIAGTLAVLAIAALVTVSVLMVLDHRQVQAEQQRAAEYIAAGRQGVVTLMSLNFNSIDDDIQRILDNSTGEFREDFEGKVEDFSQVAKESKVITEASTTAAGLESMTGDDAVVLVSARTKVTNSAGAVQEPRSWRLVINLVREGDQIKMSKVDFAP